MSKIFIVLSSLFLFVLGALAIVPLFIDWSQYKEQIIKQVQNATGYNLSINGDFDAAILPMPHVTISQVAVDSGSAKGPYAFNGSVDEASVSVALIPLFSGQIIVSDIQLINPTIDLKQQVDNSSEILDAADEKDISAKDNSFPIQIDSFYTKGAKIKYKPLDGEQISVELPEMKFSADDMKGPFEFNGQIKYQQFDLAVRGETLEKMTQDKPLPIKFNVNGGNYELDFSGIADLAKDNAEVQGQLLLTSSSIKSLASQLSGNDVQLKDQSFELKGLITGSSKAVKVSDGKLTLGNAEKAMPLKLSYSLENQKGSIKLDDIPGKGLIDLDISKNKNDTLLVGQIVINSFKILLGDVLGLVDTKTFDNPQIPQSVSGDMSVLLGKTIQLSSKDLVLGDYNLRGTKLNFKGGDAPVIDLSIDNFDGAQIKLAGTFDEKEGVNVSVSHPNAAKFIQIFKKDFESQPNLTKAFSFSGQIFKVDHSISIKNMMTKLGDIDAKGLLFIDNSSDVPSIKAELAFGNLDTQALMTGQKSTGVKGGTATTSSPQVSPWSRDAIDTSFLRSMNVDLEAKANQIIHGTWVVNNPHIDIDLNNGVLSVNKIDGGLFGGSVELMGKIVAKSSEQPINLESKINIQNVDLAKFVQAALSQTKERVTGTGNFNLDIQSTGISSSALIYGLNGDGKMTTSGLIVKGIDLAKVTEAISDESLTDLGAVIKGAFNDGQTPFEAVDYPITIREGTMPINNFTLKSATADLISNGEISFSRWEMNLKNTIKFTNPADLPSVDMTIRGPLNAPQQNVASDVLRSFIMNKYGAKIQNKVDKLLGDKLKDTPAAGIINNILGLPQQQQPKAQPSETNTPAPTSTQQPSVEQQLIKGLFGK